MLNSNTAQPGNSASLSTALKPVTVTSAAQDSLKSSELPVLQAFPPTRPRKKAQEGDEDACPQSMGHFTLTSLGLHTGSAAPLRVLLETACLAGSAEHKDRGEPLGGWDSTLSCSCQRGLSVHSSAVPFLSAPFTAESTVLGLFGGLYMQAGKSKDTHSTWII